MALNLHSTEDVVALLSKAMAGRPYAVVIIDRVPTGDKPRGSSSLIAGADLVLDLTGAEPKILKNKDGVVS